MAAMIFLCLVLLVKFEESKTVIVWDSKKHEPGTTITIPEVNMKPDINSTENQAYYNLVNPLTRYTIDEKCSKGIDFGVSFQVYTPYVNIGIADYGCKITFNVNAPFYEGFRPCVTHQGGEIYVMATKLKLSLVLSGILPHLTNQMLEFCCNKSGKINFGHYFKSIQEIEEHFDGDSEIDISFPVYGLEGKQSNSFKDFPFIPLVTAPKIVVLVPEVLFQDLNTRTQVLMKTICNAWPMLIFIVVSAMLSGLTVWFLDKKINADEFPPTFFSGAWEGIWWAFVTMTTVGYGDRSPKSPFARAFCIMWILMGIILISLFTGLVTAALSASTTPVFNIPGTKIGAVKGSIEYQIGVGMNAEMIAFDNHIDLLEEIINTRRLHAVLIDNFILSASVGLLQKNKLRLEREIDYPVTYGIVMRQNSTETEQCFRKYVRHYPQKVFEVIAKNLVPVKNPTDEVSLEVTAAEKLFYEEIVFKNVVYTETGLLVLALLCGIFWEIFVRNKDSAAYRLVGRLRRKPLFASSDSHHVDNGIECEMSGKYDRSVVALIDEYEDYHQKWIQRLREAQQKNNNEHDTSQ